MFKKISRKISRDGLGAGIIAIFRYLYYFKSRREYNQMLMLKTTKEKFSMIYQKNFWFSSESRSGEGSELSSTSHLRTTLPTLIENYKISSLVDAPCGDFNWMKLVNFRKPVKYIGIDIVETVITENIRNYGQEKISFILSDIISDQLPDCDLLLVRDALFHFSFKDIDKFLKNIANLDYKYLLTTTHYQLENNFKNRDIITGDFRLIDLHKHPFNIESKDVLEEVIDYKVGSGSPKKLLMLEKRNVPKKLY